MFSVAMFLVCVRAPPRISAAHGTPRGGMLDSALQQGKSLFDCLRPVAAALSLIGTAAALAAHHGGNLPEERGGGVSVMQVFGDIQDHADLAFFRSSKAGNAGRHL